METKLCNICCVEKEISSFYTFFSKERNQYYTTASCRSCMRIRNNEWKKNNPNASDAIQKRSRKKNGHKFYLNQVEKRKKNWIKYSHQRKTWDSNRNKPKRELVEKLLLFQKNLCGICLMSFEKYDVDHSHQTGLIRGLLCRKCNSGLHYFENKEFIEKASNYIIKYPALDFPPTKY